MARLKTVMGERMRLYQKAKVFCQRDRDFQEIIRESRKYDPSQFPYRDRILEEVIRYEFSRTGKKRRQFFLSKNKTFFERLERDRRARREDWLRNQYITSRKQAST